MAPAATGTSPLSVALEILGKCDEICRRLSLRFAAHHPHNEPLTALLHQHIKTLEAELHCLQASVSRSISDGNAIPTELIRAVTGTKLRVIELLELEHFHSCEEREGHGARAYHNEDKLIRIGLEFRDLLQEVLPGSFCDKTYSQHAFEQFLPKIEDFFAQIARQFRPRYVHTYEKLLDAPYIIDGTAPPCLGSYGIVRKSNHRRTGEALAIKTFPNVFDDETAGKILREIGILEVCDHKNIVRLVEAFKTKDDGLSMHLVITPWAPCTLHVFLHMPQPVRADRCAWFQPGSLESDLSVYRIMYELADAVTYLHANEIKHKDIKPENILLYREGNAAEITPLITDFGVSKVFSKDALTNYTDSTRSCLAPEQLHKESSTLKADIWQLGCGFAHLLALAAGGKLAHEKLLDSYMRSNDQKCSYIIAEEHSSFMGALGNICMRGNAALRRAYFVVSSMLDLDPSQRLDIECVRTSLVKTPGRAGA
ncbi:Serine/threonine-protein kinase H1 [Corynascus novoguineensis]|uniref:Serine/threonine-protein kinase H1 n=1 Tax=Corynascus novoguineensis TaxID=1126955 RepID=A0AAN7CMW9_9PEZI|nr:Serine/threonine-protein kinase H1 [Corynascus novoguineensis]